MAANRSINNVVTKRTITPFRILLLLMLLVGIYLLLPQLGSFRNTFTVLRHASWLWLAIGFVLSGLTFLAAAVTQFAAGNRAGRLSDIVLLQLAGFFVNHFLPFSLGGIDLNTRYYKKLGKHQTQAIAIATIPIIFGVATTVAIVAVVSPITLARLADQFHTSYFSARRLMLLVVAGAALFILIALIGYRQRAKKLLQEVLEGLKVIQNRQQLVLLVAGSVALTLTSALVLMASIEAVHASVGLISVFVIYVTSSLVTNVAPTPEGIGATEAVLVLALVATGLNLSQAAAITLIFRFIMFWLPTIPGGLAFRRLNRLKIL